MSLDPGSLAFRSVDGGIKLSVRLTPKASRDRIGGLETAADGSRHIKVYVRSVPEKGKANKALSSLFAKSIGCAKGRVSVVSGQTSRKKTVMIKGDTDELTAACKRLWQE